MNVPEFRYRAFISYSHQDRAWADWLHRALETYRVPRRLVGRRTEIGIIPKRIAPVFRDREELASATDLGREVNEALAQSQTLIVVCSPRAAKSRWVNEEVLSFKRLGRTERVFCLIVDGEPNAGELGGRDADECFPPALRERVGPDGAPTGERIEPVGADVRPGNDGRSRARLKLIAGILGVGFDELRRRELQSRVRRLTAVAAVAVAVMLVMSVLAIDAVVARRAAERRQKQSEELVDFMLGDLNDKLAQLQRLDIMEAVDDKAMDYFQSLPETDLTDTAREQRAKALEKIGSVRLDQGHLSAALDSYRAAVKITGELARVAPTDSQRQLAWAHDLDWIGRAHWSEGQLAAASDDFSNSQRIIAQARRLDPENVQLRFEDAVLHNNVGHVLEAEGQLDAAAVEYTRMLDLCNEQVKQTPRKEWLVELGAAHNNLGKLALMRGDLALAVAEYTSDDKIESELAARDPKDNDQRENVVTVHAILGRTLALTGDVRNGMLDLEQSVGLARQLSVLDAQNATLQEDVARYESQLARLRRLSGDLAGARSLTAHSLVALAALTSSDPDNIQLKREFAEAQTEQAAESLASGQSDAAKEQSQSAVRLLEPLRAQHSQDRQTLLAMVRARLMLAAVSPQDAPHLETAALNETESVSSNGYVDPRLQALKVEALLALDRSTDAQPVLVQLSRAGYRDLELLCILQRAHVAYPVPGAPTEPVARE